MGRVLFYQPPISGSNSYGNAVGHGLVAHPERTAFIPPESASSPVFVFTDETVNRLYGDAFVGGLQGQPLPRS